MLNLNQFVGPVQLHVLRSACKGEEGEFFAGKILEIKNTIAAMPKTNETDGQGMNAIAYLHYFTGGCDWWITERDQEQEQEQAFGYACLNGDTECAELGYISIVELLSVGAELDFYWTPKTLAEITKDF